jgi:hypothetical protein
MPKIMENALRLVLGQILAYVIPARKEAPDADDPCLEADGKLQCTPQTTTPPHFHIYSYSADGEAQVHIDRLEIMQGRISARNWRLARNWAAKNRALLSGTWQRLQALT